jgi:hypothetical protein
MTDPGQFPRPHRDSRMPRLDVLLCRVSWRHRRRGESSNSDALASLCRSFYLTTACWVHIVTESLEIPISFSGRSVLNETGKFAFDDVTETIYIKCLDNCEKKYDLSDARAGISVKALFISDSTSACAEGGSSRSRSNRV